MTGETRRRLSTIPLGLCADDDGRGWAWRSVVIGLRLLGQLQA